MTNLIYWHRTPDVLRGIQVLGFAFLLIAIVIETIGRTPFSIATVLLVSSSVLAATLSRHFVLGAWGERYGYEDES